MYVNEVIRMIIHYSDKYSIVIPYDVKVWKKSFIYRSGDNWSYETFRRQMEHTEREMKKIDPGLKMLLLTKDFHENNKVFCEFFYVHFTDYTKCKMIHNPGVIKMKNTIKFQIVQCSLDYNEVDE